jgi:lysophospholipase L1-like esterase
MIRALLIAALFSCGDDVGHRHTNQGGPSSPPPKLSGKWAVIGDSLNTEPVGNTATIQLNAKGGLWRVSNYAIGGARILTSPSVASAMDQFTTSVRGGDFKGVFVGVGYNDFKDDAITGQQGFDRLKQVFDAITADGKLIVWISMPPCRNLISTTVVQNIIDGNALAAPYVERFGGRTADWFTAVSDGATPAVQQSSRADLTSDGIHPNAAGALVRANIMEAAVP